MPDVAAAPDLRALYGPTLRQEEARVLADRGVAPEVARARGYATVETKARLQRHGFGVAQCQVPGLLIPLWRPNGEHGGYQLRPEHPRPAPDRPDRTVKYETPAKGRLCLDVPPPVRKWIQSPKAPLFVTEGSLKADALASKEVCSLSVPGVWGWRGTGELGQSTALADWEDVHLKGREVYLTFDSDVTRKRQVYEALKRFRAFLAGRGAVVWVVYLPMAEGGEKLGIDDYLVQGHEIGELLGLAQRTLIPPPDAEHARHTPYRIAKHGLEYLRATSQGEEEIQLTNFVAIITAQILQDDGQDEKPFVELEARRNGTVHAIALPLDEFKTMEWPDRFLGVEAIVYPNRAPHTLTAIKELSGEILKRTRYTHLGWRRVGEEWVYLHAGGAIGRAGLAPHIEVALEDPLDRYVLPAPPDGAALEAAVRASLGILEVAPDAVTCPLLASIYRSVIAPCQFSLYLWGTSGAGKSQLAALAQQHFGPAMHASALPANWTSTGNALEGIAFAAKEAILVVDDFAPSGSISDVNALYRQAERLLRAQGNNAGRQRMRADSSLRAAKRPRGLIVSTGEDSQRHSSIRARLFEIEVGADVVDFDHVDGTPGKLSACQADAAAGLYAQCLAAFLRWLADRRETVLQEMPIKLAEWRRKATSSALHRRTPDTVANLQFGARLFAWFAQDAGVLTPEEGAVLEQRIWRAVGKAAAKQAEEAQAVDPARKFVELLRAAVSAGRAHVAGMDGGEPEHLPAAWGWRRAAGIGGVPEWRPLGDRVGFVRGDDVYLQPMAAYQIAQRMGANSTETLPVTARTLWKRLDERGILASKEAGHLTIWRSVGGNRDRVLHVKGSQFFGVSTQLIGEIGEIGEQADDLISDRPLPPVIAPRLGGSDHPEIGDEKRGAEPRSGGFAPAGGSERRPTPPETASIDAPEATPATGLLPDKLPDFLENRQESGSKDGPAHVQNGPALPDLPDLPDYFHASPHTSVAPSGAQDEGAAVADRGVGGGAVVDDEEELVL